MTVSKTDPGAYRTIGEALAAAPINQAQMFYVHISAGVYVESVLIPENLTNMVLIGDGADVTKVTMNRHAPEFQAFQSGTLTIFGAGFIAKFITFENSAGPGSQAVAVVIQAERFVMESFLDSFISPPGWEIWPGNPTDKLTYVEYKNRGPGADTSHRVNWTGYRALEDAAAMKQFTVQEILDRESWIPHTGIPYTAGFIYV
ncbi:putative pectinesterase/pectinesterase inhibitor 34-like [Dorcoceras hygrometricum]|uniref:Putative pectinesterase/pectinesterase inhibitor 34-like n=1 Tax=Dorcoceras hygrometricum TaxID=472368 RepID=A0A2Z7B1G1_9LAMI|nr:putative pectinesterase/pectinesterase inhibitor 34-like [Dorcoceras hygrometricum]